MAIECREIRLNTPEYEAEVDLRFRVLREPLGLTFRPEDLSSDVTDWHIGAFDGEQLVGCLILVPQPEQWVKMRQVAVEPTRQGQSIGRLMVEFAERFAEDHGYFKIRLNARENAIPFYKKLGYAVEGEPFEEIGIPHQYMVMIRRNP